MKKSILTLTAFIALNATVLMGAEQIRTQDMPIKDMKSQNKRLIKMVVAEISNSLPQVVDKYTKFTKISNKDLTLIYTFEIDTGDKDDDDVIKQSEDRMRKVVKNGICQSSKRFLYSDINISYVYTSAKTKTKLFQIDVTKKDCPKK